jgi:hypothetical protein
MAMLIDRAAGRSDGIVMKLPPSIDPAMITKIHLNAQVFTDAGLNKAFAALAPHFPNAEHTFSYFHEVEDPGDDSLSPSSSSRSYGKTMISASLFSRRLKASSNPSFKPSKPRERTIRRAPIGSLIQMPGSPDPETGGSIEPKKPAPNKGPKRSLPRRRGRTGRSGRFIGQSAGEPFRRQKTGARWELIGGRSDPWSPRLHGHEIPIAFPHPEAQYRECRERRLPSRPPKYRPGHPWDEIEWGDSLAGAPQRSRKGEAPT